MLTFRYIVCCVLALLIAVDSLTTYAQKPAQKTRDSASSKKNAQRKEEKLPSPASGKNSQAKKNENEAVDEATADIKQQKLQQALFLLNSITNIESSAQSNVLKIKILSIGADALWKHDEPRARALFIQAFEEINSVKFDPEKDQRAAIAKKTGDTESLLLPLRKFVLQRIAERDYLLAKSLKEKLSPDKEKGQSVNSSLSEKKNNETVSEHLNQALVESFAVNNPDKVSEIIRTNLAEGVSEHFVESLIGIRRSNPQLANKLFTEVLMVIRNAPFSVQTIKFLSRYSFERSEVEEHSKLDIMSDPIRVSDIKLFLDYVHQALVTRSERQNGFAQSPDVIRQEIIVFNSLIPYIERIYPERLDFMRSQLAILANLTQTTTIETVRSAGKETFEDVAAKAASQVDDRRKTILLIKASGMAAADGKFDEALNLAERIPNPDDRKVQTAILLAMQSDNLLRKKQVAEALRLARKMEFLPQRSGIFRRIAQFQQKEKKPDEALRTLEELWDWFATQPNTPQKATALLDTIGVIAQLDIEKGFDLLNDLITTFGYVDFSAEYKPNPKRVITEVQYTLDMLKFETGFEPFIKSNPLHFAQVIGNLLPQEAAFLSQVIACHKLLTQVRDSSNNVSK